MMNKHLLQGAGLATFLLAIQLTGFSQEKPGPGEAKRDTLDNAIRNNDEIIIKHKSNKDAKVTIEIKDGQAYVNGKPASEYEDDNLVIIKRKTRNKSATFRMDGGDMNMTPFRNKGSWSMDGIDLSGERAFLGVTSIRTENGPAGAKVGEVSPGSAAEKAGIKEGDLITKVEEMVIDGPEDLARTIGKYKPEDKVTLTLTRDGKEQKVAVTLGKTNVKMAYGFKAPDSGDFPEEFKRMMPPGAFKYRIDVDGNSPRLGIHARDTEDGKGVKVLEVDDESNAAKAGIKEGDIITKFDGVDVNSATSLAQKARESRTKPSVHISVIRGGKTMDFDIKTPRKLKTADL